MKNKLLLLLLIASLFACKPEPEPIPDKHNYNYLTAEQLAKTPYFTNPAFDTLTFVSNQNDTVVFAKTRVDSGWYREIEFDPGVEFTKYHYYQQISANYQTIKGEGSYKVIHSKKINSFFGAETDLIQILFANYEFGVFDRHIGSTTYVGFIGDFRHNNIHYEKVLYTDFKGDLKKARAYLNKDYGVFYVLDSINNKNWTIIH